MLINSQTRYSEAAKHDINMAAVRKIATDAGLDMTNKCNYSQYSLLN